MSGSVFSRGSYPDLFFSRGSDPDLVLLEGRTRIRFFNGQIQIFLKSRIRISLNGRIQFFLLGSTPSGSSTLVKIVLVLQ